MNTKLTVLAESRNLSDGVICVVPSTSEAFRASLRKAVMQLNGTKSGRQLFTMFQSSGVTAFSPAQLEGLEDLPREHGQLKKTCNYSALSES